MRFKIICRWNSVTVLEGYCSAVMAYHTILGMTKEFGNAEKAGFVVPSLTNINGMMVGQILRGEGADPTGRASYYLETLTNP